MKSTRYYYIAYKNGVTFVGTAEECAKRINSFAKNIRKVSEGGCINGHLIKRISRCVFYYIVEVDGKTHESKELKELEKIVWYSTETIRRYCQEKHEIGNTKFYRREVVEDIELPTTRNYRE